MNQPEKLTLEQLEKWLWDSANIMRGSIDSSDFKNYIFGLLFLKRINDVFLEKITEVMLDDECDEAEAIETIKSDWKDEKIFVPEDGRWSNIIAKTENVGEAIDQAFAEIEMEYTDLEGVLTSVQFGDKEKLSNDLLMRLLRHFNHYKIGNKNIYKDDMLGDAYEYLIAQFADDAGKKGGEFYTPHQVVKLIVALINPQPTHEIYDPTFGCGGMLLESARHVAKQPNGVVAGKANCTLYGQEKNLGTWAVAKLNMFLHNLNADLMRGDTLTDPKLKTGTQVKTFDRVIANPPFSSLDWWTPLEVNKTTKTDKNGKETEIAPDYKKQLTDPYGRFIYGIAPRKKADLAFVQHMIASLKQNGRMGVVVPHGVLFRAGEEGKIRKGFFKGIDGFQGDLIEGVIGLPSGLFYNTGIPAAILLINKSKPKVLKNRVVFIDGSRDYQEGKNQNVLRDTDINKVVSHFNNAITKLETNTQTIADQNECLASVTVDKYLRIVDIAEIEENDFNLNIPRYVDTFEEEAEIDLVAVRHKRIKLQHDLKTLEAEMQGYLVELGYGN